MKASIKQNILLSFVFSMFSVVAILVLLWVQGITPSNLPEGVEIPEISPVLIMVVSSIQFFITTFVMSLVGLTLAPKVNLHLPFFQSLVDKSNTFTWSRKWIIISILGGCIGFISLALMDKYVFQPFVPEFGEVAETVWYKGLLAGVLYGGIWEEIAIRLFLMTLIIWIVSKIFRKKADNIPAWVYWFGIIFAAIMFGIGHLPATQALVGTLTTAIVIRAIVLNGVIGVFCGYLYWKKGLIYAIIAHAFVHIFHYGILVHIL
ncbi:type II CAAX prenyl endopeptidase Rce1 family protein [Bacillus salitolerans]|uniref:Type II CAAX prenyl endopeptidase Rce1 family protein n=1 Tax=Bacillus salitolerans TaxID=1437434 RepID=A0ABW4LXL6_9BACI